MGMSTHVVGFREADDKWKKMKEAWEACENAGIEIPEDVLNFFDHEEPGDKPGQEIDLGDAVYEWRSDYEQGYELDITKLPKGLTKVRFYNSY